MYSVLKRRRRWYFLYQLPSSSVTQSIVLFIILCRAVAFCFLLFLYLFSLSPYFSLCASCSIYTLTPLTATEMKSYGCLQWESKRSGRSLRSWEKTASPLICVRWGWEDNCCWKTHHVCLPYISFYRSAAALMIVGRPPSPLIIWWSPSVA